MEFSYESLKRSWLKIIDWGVDNPDKFRFMLQFNSSPYNTDETRSKFAEHENKLVEFVKEGIKNQFIKDLPPEYILEFLTAHLTFTMDYIVQTNTKERSMFFDAFFEGIKLYYTS